MHVNTREAMHVNARRAFTCQSGVTKDLAMPQMSKKCLSYLSSRDGNRFGDNHNGRFSPCEGHLASSYDNETNQTLSAMETGSTVSQW